MMTVETITETLPAADEVDRLSVLTLEDLLPTPLEETYAQNYRTSKRPSVFQQPEFVPTFDIKNYCQIYCQGRLLKDVSLAHIFNDSKTFVDKKLRYKESEIVQKYTQLLNATPNPDPVTLAHFVEQNFEDGNELMEWTPPDFSEKPDLYNRVVDKEYKKWVLELNQIWHILARKVKEDVKNNQDMYSLLYTPNGFFIPGGRFTELYYWDTYWILQGILLCDMKQTAKGVIENILSLVELLGFMPNGARVYYAERSQPPLLIPMVATYVKHTRDTTFVKTHIQALTHEFEYWMKNKAVMVQKDGREYRMVRYYAPSEGPRPESYREDYEVAEDLQTEQDKQNLYIELKSGAETGFDFSSRWFITPDGTDKGTLKDIRTSQIIPVDLNSIIHLNARYLSEWWLTLGNKELSQKYQKIGYEFQEAIQEVLWNEEQGSWLDWDLQNKKPRPYFYGSNLAPLWTKSYGKMDRARLSNKIIKYLKSNGIIEENLSSKFYGTPTSTHNSSQQWDYPNAWAPLQAYIIQGLDYLKEGDAQVVSYNLADLWLKTNYKGFKTHQAMFEKYDVNQPGETGGGGEYVAQTGFGWTNGFVFELLERYGKTISPAGENRALDDNEDDSHFKYTHHQTI